MTHDEGSCYLPAVLRNATLLTHWGRKDLGHKSGSAYDPDRYSDEVYHPLWQRERHLNKLGKYPCYNPEKVSVFSFFFSFLFRFEAIFLSIFFQVYEKCTLRENQ